MGEIKIESEEYLGPFVGHRLTLEIGAFQSMVFVTSDVGLYWVTAAESKLKGRTD
jgi:hypothetical protein